ncbi:hypothetical protein FOL46_003786 [Perkinsus olseni]|uniref:Uncharacterized protein n=1 Tax=Perkinsus olseni TaxID=32597 RepID=A0A7J6KKG1_PEROL|nr:hypothetical protein FOL46_003786 [Perkinsus olseni]
MPAPKTTYCPPFRSLWFGDDEIDDGALWPRGKSLKYKLEEILGVDHKSYGSNRKNETPHFRTFICASHCGCQFKVAAT